MTSVGWVDSCIKGSVPIPGFSNSLCFDAPSCDLQPLLSSALRYMFHGLRYLQVSTFTTIISNIFQVFLLILMTFLHLQLAPQRLSLVSVPLLNPGLLSRSIHLPSPFATLLVLQRQVPPNSFSALVLIEITRTCSV